MFRKLIFITLTLIFVGGCSSNSRVSTPTIAATKTNIPASTAESVSTAESTPTIIPTSTPFGSGGIPRIAVFTESDGGSVRLIRIGHLDFGETNITFDDTKLKIGEKLNTSMHREQQPPIIRWSPNGNFLAYIWVENGTAKIYIYNFADQEQKWELEIQGGNFRKSWENDILWSADSNWVYFNIDRKSHYVLDVSTGTINSFADKQIQNVEWHAQEPILYFENSGGSSFYQFDPATNQISQIEPVKFDPAPYTDIQSFNTFGTYDQGINGYLFSAQNNDNSNSIYFTPTGGQISEFMRIYSNEINHFQDVKIIRSPDKSSYLIGGYGQPVKEDGKRLFSFIVKETSLPLTIKDHILNGISPILWSPDGKSYIGYQYINKTSQGIGAVDIDTIVKVVIVDVETNSIVKDYEINLYKSNFIYNFNINTVVPLPGTSIAGFDVYWP